MGFAVYRKLQERHAVAHTGEVRAVLIKGKSGVVVALLIGCSVPAWAKLTSGDSVLIRGEIEATSFRLQYVQATSPGIAMDQETSVFEFRAPEGQVSHWVDPAPEKWDVWGEKFFGWGWQKIVLQNPRLVLVDKRGAKPRIFFKFRVQPGDYTHGCMPLANEHAPNFEVRVRDGLGNALFSFTYPGAAIFYENGGGRAHCEELTDLAPFKLDGVANTNVIESLYKIIDRSSGASNGSIYLDIKKGQLTMDCRNGDSQAHKDRFSEFMKLQPPRTLHALEACDRASDGKE